MGIDSLSSFTAMVPGAGHGNFTIGICNVLINPWVQLAFIAVPCIVLVVGRRFKRLAAFLCIPASSLMLRHITVDISAPFGYGETLLLFAGGFLVITSIQLYYYHVLKQ